MLHHCHHPAIVQVRDSFSSFPFSVIVMPLHQTTLDKAIQSVHRDGLPPEMLKSTVLSMAAALKEMHAKEIAHTDLHTNQILLSGARLF